MIEVGLLLTYAVLALMSHRMFQMMMENTVKESTVRFMAYVWPLSWALVIAMIVYVLIKGEQDDRP